MLLTRGTGDVNMKSLTTLTENKPLMWQGSVGADLQHLEKDRAIHTDPDETRRRRTIKLQREKNTWGFTLQTYGIKNKKTNELEVMTYVDYVELNGPAGLAGMRRGDVILSVNGETVEGIPHRKLVDKIQETKGTSLRLVVLFEDCCRKVELYERFIKLKQVLKMKQEELRCLERKEHFILEGHGGFSRVSSVRSSLRSSSSSDWDRFSMVVSPAQMNMPNKPNLHQHFLFPRSYASSQDDSSEVSLNDITLNDSFSDDSDAFQSSSCSDIVSIQSLRRSKKDSLSNRSVSSLVTHAEEKENSTDADKSSEKQETCDGVDSEKVVFTIEQDEDYDFSDNELHSAKLNSTEMDKEVESKEEPIQDGNQNKTNIKGDNYSSDSKTGDIVKPNQKEHVPVLKNALRETGNENQIQGTSCKEDNSTNDTKPKKGKRLVNGILVNDCDQDTKL